MPFWAVNQSWWLLLCRCFHQDVSVFACVQLQQKLNTTPSRRRSFSLQLFSRCCFSCFMLFRRNFSSILQCLNNIACQNIDRKSFLLLLQVPALLSVFVSPHLPDHPHLSSISPNTGLCSPQALTKLTARFFFFAPVSVMIDFMFSVF